MMRRLLDHNERRWLSCKVRVPWVPCSHITSLLCLDCAPSPTRGGTLHCLLTLLLPRSSGELAEEARGGPAQEAESGASHSLDFKGNDDAEAASLNNSNSSSSSSSSINGKKTNNNHAATELPDPPAANASPVDEADEDVKASGEGMELNRQSTARRFSSAPLTHRSNPLLEVHSDEAAYFRSAPSPEMLGGGERNRSYGMTLSLSLPLPPPLSRTLTNTQHRESSY
jgi:hypothetical protein